MPAVRQVDGVNRQPLTHVWFTGSHRDGQGGVPVWHTPASAGGLLAVAEQAVVTARPIGPDGAVERAAVTVAAEVSVVALLARVDDGVPRTGCGCRAAPSASKRRRRRRLNGSPAT